MNHSVCFSLFFSNPLRRKAFATLVRLSPASLFLLAACSGSSDGATSSRAPSETGAVAARKQQVTYALPRGGKSAVSIDTLPNASCTLRNAGEISGTDKHLTVFADDDGVARLYLRNTDPAVDHREFALDCKDDAGRTTSHEIEVNVDDAAVSQAPVPFSTAGKRKLPRLDVDPMSLSFEELLNRGYPPRPDPETAPAQYAQWLDVAQREPTLIEPHRVTDFAGPRHGPAKIAPPPANGGSPGYWSGYVIQTGAKVPQFDMVFGELQVPRVSSAYNSSLYSSLWVGLDGYFTQTVVQDGTEQDAFGDVIGVEWSSYYGWTEWYPANPAPISNFPVQPEDVVYAWTWVANSSGNIEFPKTIPGQPYGFVSTGEPWSSIPFDGTVTNVLADVNGDGKADAVGINPTNIWVMLSNGTSFGTEERWSNGPFDGTVTNLLADVNGDGEADVVGFNPTSIWVMTSEGISFGTEEQWSSGAFDGTVTNLLADVNGDGMADVVGINPTNIWVMLSNGTSFDPEQQWSSIPFDGSVTNLLADVNGDGKADLVGFNPTNIWVMLSNGTSFGPEQQWSTVPFDGTVTNLVADVNGDGRADAVGFNATNIWVMLSNGSSFGPEQQWSSAPFDGTVTNLLADVNGDGRADAVGFNTNNSWVMLSQAFAGDLSPGSIGYFYLYNETENVASPFSSTTQPANTTFTGHQAEWIMEWPGLGAGNGLAPYGSTEVSGAWASDYGGASYLYSSASSTQVTMTNGSITLSSVAPVNQSTMEFTWQNYNYN